jgi:hypothetical protein
VVVGVLLFVIGCLVFVWEIFAYTNTPAPWTAAPTVTASPTPVGAVRRLAPGLASPRAVDSGLPRLS